MITGVAIQTSNYDWDNVGHSTKNTLVYQTSQPSSINSHVNLYYL